MNDVPTDMPTRITSAIRSFRLSCRDGVTARFAVHPVTFIALANLPHDWPFRVSLQPDGSSVLCGYGIDRDPSMEIGDVKLLAEFR